MNKNKIKKKAGVYRITNRENGKRYYGSSNNLKKRWYNHKSEMRLGKHKNPGIRADAVTYGPEAFEFEVLCYCSPEERKRLEGAVIDRNYGNSCYNDAKGDGARSEETRAKISETLKGKPLSEEHKAKLRMPKPKVTCPHCNKTGGVNIMNRWHFDNCKLRQEQ